MKNKMVSTITSVHVESTNPPTLPPPSPPVPSLQSIQILPRRARAGRSNGEYPQTHPYTKLTNTTQEAATMGRRKGDLTETWRKSQQVKAELNLMSDLCSSETRLPQVQSIINNVKNAKKSSVYSKDIEKNIERIIMQAKMEDAKQRV